MSNKPNVDEQKKFVMRDDVWKLWQSMGMDTESFVDFATKLHAFCQAEIAQAKQQTCDDIVGLLASEMEVRPASGPKRNGTAQALRRARNKIRTQTIDAINKYKGDM